MTLEDHLKDNRPPSTKVDISKFWESFLGVTNGLYAIHNAPLPRESMDGPHIFHG